MFESNVTQPKNEKGGAGGLFILLGFLFLPAVITGFLFYKILLVKLKQKPSVSFVVAAIINTIIVSIVVKSGSFLNFIEVFINYKEIMNNWSALIPFAISLNLFLGVAGGFFAIIWQIFQMKKNPDRLKVEGGWEYKFKYRRSPLEILRRKKIIEKLKNGSFLEDEKAPLGLDEAHGDLVTYRYDSEAIRQTLISGAVGSGKTVSMLSLILADIKCGKPIVVVDFKRDPKLASKLSMWSKEYGTEFYHFVKGSPKDYDIPGSPGQAFWDPLAVNSVTARADMVLNMREYDTASAVYREAMQQLLQVLFAMLDQADKSKAPSLAWHAGGIHLIASAMKGGNFSELVAACENTDIENEAVDIEIQSKSKGQIRHAMDELSGQMRTITASEYGKWMVNNTAERNIDLFELTKTGSNVILFSLNADDEPAFAKYVGSLIMSNLTSASARRRNSAVDNQVNVYVDEFQILPAPSVAGLLEKSRASNIGMTLALQSFDQIIAASSQNGEAYLSGILDTCYNFIIHAGATEDSATKLSKILGKKFFTVYSKTNHSQNFFWSWNWSNKRNQVIQTREEEKWIFPPSDFMSLSSPMGSNKFKSTAIIVNKTTMDPRFVPEEGGAVARKVLMIPDSKVLEEYYVPGVITNPEAKVTIPKEIAEEFNDESISEFLAIGSDSFDASYNDRAEEDSSQYKNDYEPVIEEEPLVHKPTDEESDGDFEWEVVEEPAPDYEMDELNSFDISKSSRIASNDNEDDLPDLSSEVKSSYSNYSEKTTFDATFKTGFVPQSRQNKGSNKKEVNNKLAPTADFDDEDALPDIDF